MAKNKNLELTPLGRTAYIVGLIASGVIVLMVILSLFNVLPGWFDEMYVMAPAMSVVLFTQGMREWKRDRFLSFISYVVAVFLIVITIKKIVS